VHAHAHTSPLELGGVRSACEYCALFELCWPRGLDASNLRRLQSMVRHTDVLPCGSHLFRVGDEFTAIYAVRSGCIKSYTVDRGGHEFVHGFHLRGEMLGFDAVYPDRHCCNALILESCSLCVIPYRDITRLSQDVPSMQRQLIRVMSHEFATQLRNRGGYGATQRVAAFLVNICSRLRQPDSTTDVFRLPMSREDIASYLSISPETLSRLLAKLHGLGLVDVDRRNVRLVDVTGLDQIAQGIH